MRSNAKELGIEKNGRGTSSKPLQHAITMGGDLDVLYSPRVMNVLYCNADEQYCICFQLLQHCSTLHFESSPCLTSKVIVYPLKGPQVMKTTLYHDCP